MKKLFKNLHKTKLAILPTFLLIVLICSLLATFEVLFEDKFFPGSYIGDTNLVYLTKAEAYSVLNAKFEQRKSQQLAFQYSSNTYQIDLATSSAVVSFDQAIEQVFKVGRGAKLNENIYNQVRNLFFRQDYHPQVVVFLDHQYNTINQQIFTPTIDGSLIVDENQIRITESKNGLELDRASLTENITNYLISGIISPELPVRSLEPKITTSKLQKAKYFLESAKDSPVQLVFEKDRWEVDYKTLITLLDLEADPDKLVSGSKVENYLKSLAGKINQPVREGQFEFNKDSGRVSTFSASQDGRELDLAKTTFLLTEALEGRQPKEIQLPVTVVKPKINTAEVNNLGIKELLGRGVSHFAHSIENRIFNLSLAASRINGTLISPGETFSFNKTVGDISGSSGYKPAYVIKSGRTVLDDGGGVCQVSTTVFRAVLNSGLPVVARTAHAYRVGYYEQSFPPGLDATVFSPTVDFIFKNDTGNHVLVQAYREGTTLYVDLYGTSDGRVASISKSVVNNVTPAPPELRQDDPTLPKGTVKQVDFAAAGASVSFNRTVTRAGQTLISETFKSAYKPWQAVYLVGTQ